MQVLHLRYQSILIYGNLEINFPENVKPSTLNCPFNHLEKCIIEKKKKCLHLIYDELFQNFSNRKKSNPKGKNIAF